MSQVNNSHPEDKQMDEITKKLQKIVAQRRLEKVVYNHNDHNRYARKAKSTSFDSYYSASVQE